MRVPSNPLSEEEESQLTELLSGSDSVPLSYARGVLSALACEPSLEDPSDWLPLVLGGEVPNRETLKRVFSLLMRDRFAVRECLELGQPYVPAKTDEEEVTRFCKGFVRATRKSQVWQNDVDALGQTLPIAVLAGYLSVDSLRKLNPDLVIDEPSWKSEQGDKLGELVLGLYRHFEPRREVSEAQSRAGVEKIGRNEPCPCGSGKKFKKCCGAG